MLRLPINVQKPQISVTKTIARAMILILLVSISSAAVTTSALFSSLDDAGAINVAGSLRMQSYRLAYDIETQSAEFTQHLSNYQTSLNAPELQSIDNWFTPQSLIDKYTNLITLWHEFQPALLAQDKTGYLEQIAEFVAQIDLFVFELQKFSEFKLKLLTISYGIGITLILLIAFYITFYTQRKIVLPLNQLVKASKQVQGGDFRVKLVGNQPNELGILANVFNNMAYELEKLYFELENKVVEKTRKLAHANISLQTLYGCSQELSVSYLEQENFRNMLGHLLDTEGMTALKLTVEEGPDTYWEIVVGNPTPHRNWLEEPLRLDDEILGRLEWQYALPCPDNVLVHNVAKIIARGIYYNRAQKQAQQLILMEERATIARELHDSLAQSLSYLKIQTTLLNRHISKNDNVQSEVTAKEIDRQLSVTYTQLRELLTTFRLTIDNPHFGEALNELMTPLKQQTSAHLIIDNHLSGVSLQPNRQIHVLQIIREAVLNAMKHAQATEITIHCQRVNDLAYVTISDNGIGLCTEPDKPNHYGLSIMTERAERLSGQLSVNSSGHGGCQVVLSFPIQPEA